MLLHTATVVATEEITLTHMIMFDKALFTLSATKEHKTPAIHCYPRKEPINIQTIFILFLILCNIVSCSSG